MWLDTHDMKVEGLINYIITAAQKGKSYCTAQKI